MRIEQPIEPQERATALLIERLAEAIQQCCYYLEAQGLSSGTVKALHRCFRQLKPAVIFYRGEGEHTLLWDPPTGKFAKGAK